MTTRKVCKWCKRPLTDRGDGPFPRYVHPSGLMICATIYDAHGQARWAEPIDAL